MPPTSYFSYPNRAQRERQAIRKRVLLRSRASGAGAATSLGTPLATNGTIRMATWSFDDWDIARALVAARKRGVSVQIIAAKAANKTTRVAVAARAASGSGSTVPGYPTDAGHVSFARSVPGRLPWSGRHAALEVLPLRQGRPAATPQVTVQRLDRT